MEKAIAILNALLEAVVNLLRRIGQNEPADIVSDVADGIGKVCDIVVAE